MAHWSARVARRSALVDARRRSSASVCAVFQRRGGGGGTVCRAPCTRACACASPYLVRAAVAVAMVVRAWCARRGAPCARAAANARAQPRQPREDAAGGAPRASESDARDGDARAAHASVMASIDDALSKRFIALDPAGYFVIRARGDAIEARHYKNIIGEDGLARDPETNEVIPCDGSYKPVVNAEFTGRTAKEISVKIFERDGRDANDGVCTMMSHANYLGREFQRAEWCIRQGIEYVQD